MGTILKHFEDVLEECITAIQERGEAVGECLARYPARRHELEPLLHLTVRLRAARTVTAAPGFRQASAIRVRNLAAARPQRKRRALQPLRGRGRVAPSARRKLPAVVGIAVTLWLAAGGGAIYASGGALPGDALYPVKRAVETARLAASLDAGRDARLRLAFAERRLDEMARLVAEGRPEAIGQATTGYRAQLEAVGALLEKGEDMLSPEDYADLAGTLIATQPLHEDRLAALRAQAPEAAQPGVELALAASRAARERALEALDDGSDKPGVPDPTPTGMPAATQPSTRRPTLTPAPTATEPPTQQPVPTPTTTPTVRAPSESRPTETPSDTTDTTGPRTGTPAPVSALSPTPTASWNSERDLATSATPTERATQTPKPARSTPRKETPPAETPRPPTPEGRPTVVDAPGMTPPPTPAVAPGVTSAAETPPPAVTRPAEGPTADQP